MLKGLSIHTVAIISTT